MSPSKVWFILSEGQVKGPCDAAEIERLISTTNDAQIWGRGQSEWMSPARWRQALKDGAHISPLSPEAPGLWKVRVEGNERAPMLYADLISFLKKQNDYSSVDVCLENGQGGWKEVYAIPKLAEDLGVTRRSLPRVPLVGTLTCESDEGEFKCRVISISEGGLGVNDARNLKIGQQFKGTLTSSNLFVTITSTCEVVYVGADGYAGLRFVGLPFEFKSSIIEYVNKFATT